MTTKLHVRDWASIACGAVNEDLFGAAGDWAWMIDGATGLGGPALTPGASDAAWLAGELDAAAARARDLPPARWLTAIEEALDEAFAPFRSGEPAGFPAAALAAVRLESGRLVALNIGDCALWVRPPGGRARRIGRSRVDRFDRKVEAILERALAAGRVRESVEPEMREQIARNRTRANTRFGYWVVRPGSPWSRRVRRRGATVPDGAQLVLATDGFYRLVDVYRRYDDEAFMDACLDGLAPLMEELRAIEAKDRGCRRHPRIKPSDDATAMVLEVCDAR